MQLNDNLLHRWERIISEVNKTDVPIECIKKVVIKLTGGRQKTINLQSLQKQGLSMEEIENLLSRTLSAFDTEIRDIDFVVDPETVAGLVQPETDKLLKGM